MNVAAAVAAMLIDDDFDKATFPQGHRGTEDAARPIGANRAFLGFERGLSRNLQALPIIFLTRAFDPVR
jgi:hypothetical protein